MAFKITLPEDHEAVVYLDSVINQEYSEFIRNHWRDIYFDLRGVLEEHWYQELDEEFDAIIRQSKLIRGLQSNAARQAIHEFARHVRKYCSSIAKDHESHISRVKDILPRLVTTDEYDVYEFRRFVRQGTTFNLVEIELLKKRIQVDFDALRKDLETYISNMSQLQEIMNELNSIATRFEELAKQPSTDLDEVESLQKLYDQERDRMKKLLLADKGDTKNNVYGLDKIDEDHVLIVKGALNEFKNLCKEYLISNVASTKVTLNHDDICKQILDFSSEELTVTSELERIISDCVTEFIKIYSETQEKITLVRSWYVHDEYALDTYRSKPFSDWYANLPIVIANVLRIEVRAVLMMSDGRLTFKYIPSQLLGNSCYPTEQVYKGMLLKDNDEFIEMCNEYGLEISDEKSMYEAAEQFKKEKGCLSRHTLSDSYLPNIGKVLEIKI